MNRDSKNYTCYETDFIVKGTLKKKLDHHRWTMFWTFRSENLLDLLANQWTRSWIVGCLCKPS